VEREIALGEIAARQRRASTQVVIRADDVRFESSSWPGIEVAYVVDPRLGMEVMNFTLEMHRIQPGVSTLMHRDFERVVHILAGHGHTIQDGQRVEWGPHDSLHLKMGSWRQHTVDGDSEPAIMLVGKADIVIDRIGPYLMIGSGDSWSDLPDDFRPEHPFTRALVDVPRVGGEKWQSEHQSDAKRRRLDLNRDLDAGRVIMRADDVKIERSVHKGDWRAALIDEAVGFSNQLLGMYVQQLPPDCHTETHKHGEAIVYVLSGAGYTIVDGARVDWQAGDCILIQPGQWHQHFNIDKERYSQHLTVNIFPLQNRLIHKRFVEAYEPDL
jgi:gentisate 1,2-dioxygenase